MRVSSTQDGLVNLSFYDELFHTFRATVGADNTKQKPNPNPTSKTTTTTTTTTTTARPNTLSLNPSQQHQLKVNRILATLVQVSAANPRPTKTKSKCNSHPPFDFEPPPSSSPSPSPLLKKIQNNIHTDATQKLSRIKRLELICSKNRTLTHTSLQTKKTSLADRIDEMLLTIMTKDDLYKRKLQQQKESARRRLRELLSECLGEVSERAFWKTSILAMKVREMASDITVTSTTKLIHPICSFGSLAAIVVR